MTDTHVMIDVDAAIEEVIAHIEVCEDEEHSTLLSKQLDSIRDLVAKSDTKPQVYFTIDGGVGDYEVRGDVDVVFIDWDNVTPDAYIDPSEALDPMDDAIDGSLRLPENEGTQNLRQMLEWLRDNLLDFPENDGYKRGRELEERIVKALSDRGAHP